MRLRRIWMMAAVFGLVAALAPAAASGQEVRTKLGGDALAVREVTATVEGRSAAAAAAERWNAMGFVVDRRALTVLDVSAAGDGTDLVVASAPDDVRTVTTRLRNGKVRWHMALATPSAPPKQLGVRPVGAEAGPQTHGESWSLVAANCFARDENNTGWIDHCYKMHKYSGQVGGLDVYSLHHDATAKSKSVWTLRRAEIYARQHPNSSTMWWYDWDPGSDMPGGNCVSVDVGIEIAGVDISFPFTWCDEWDIDKRVTAGEFDNTWKGWAWRSEREVAYAVGVKVPSGGWPQWYLYKTFWAD